ncbi:hypothetical protein [Phenylobacterium sp.]|uniref:hypothetical protein n=1 Tax=Phenylobacterium sp. TaxID=1871053 RepID=UPI00121958B9|nr:hypothetical protein [Phenylobacterium sp.]THD63878.1 MAG: hypothetical protein E8A49_04165 [Phenylobacterium sp.]
MSTDQMQSGAAGTAAPPPHPSHTPTRALTAYALGLPAQPDTGEISRHLEACGTCAAFVAELEESEGRRLLDSPPAELWAGALGFALAGIARPQP